MSPNESMEKIKKFDGENFHLWKFKMQMLFEERDLWEVVPGDEVIETCTSEEGIVKFKKKMKKAFAMICLAMDDAQLAMVKSCKEARSAWQLLESHYEKKSLATNYISAKSSFLLL